MNLDTYKVHSLGDYVEAIQQYGTTDSYTTELVNVYYISDMLKLIVEIGRIGTSDPQDKIFSNQSKRILEADDTD